MLKDGKKDQNTFRSIIIGTSYRLIMIYLVVQRSMRHLEAGKSLTKRAVIMKE